MAQHAASDLPTFYGETTRDGRVVQRSTDDAPEEILTPPAQACQACHQHQHSQQLNSIVPFERPCEGPRNNTRFDQSDAPLDDRYRRRNKGPRHRNSDLDWDERARQRVSRNNHRRRADCHRSRRDHEVDSDSGYDDYYGDHRGMMPSDYRRRNSHRSYQGRSTPERVSDGYDGPDVEKKVNGPSTEVPMRLPWTMWMNSNLKNHFVATIGEFMGTTMFLFFAFAGTQVANIKSTDSANSTSGGATGFNPEVLLYIALSFGFSLTTNVWCYYRISGGLFNPAVTLAMVLVKSIPLVRAALLVGAQIAGSIFASFLVQLLFSTPFNVRTTLAPGTSLVQGVFIEAILTAELVFTIFMLAKEKHKATFIAPVGIGLALFIAELVGVYYTGGSLNPARSLGPCVITGIFDQEHWIYWVGPATGAILAVIFYKFIKTLEYEMANLG